MSSPTERDRQLVDRAPDGILVCQDGRLTFANPAALALLGAMVPDDVVGTSVLDCFHDDAQHGVRAALQAWSAGHPLQIDARLLRPAAEAIDVEISGVRLDDSAAADDQREGCCLQIVLRDVTARVRREAALRDSEAALRDSESRLAMAVAGSLEGVWDWDLSTDAVVYSTRWKQMLGYHDDEIEPHVSAWERLVHPADRVRADRAHESVASGEATYEAEFRLRHKEGHYVHVLSRGFPVRREPDGAVVRIVGTHLDLSERKRAEAALRESEERLRLAFAGAQEGVWDWNLETGAVVYSARWKGMLGYDEHEIEPHISAWERLLHPEDIPRAQQASDTVATGGAYEGEFRLRHKDGHFLHVLSRGFPVRRDPDGPVVRIVGTHFDLTERKEAEVLLRRAHEELEKRVQERTAELALANAALRDEMSERERAERARTELLSRLVFAQEDERRRIAREMHDQFGEQLTALEHGIARLKDSCGDQPFLASHVGELEAVTQRLDRDVEQLVWELRPTALDDLGLRAALTNYVQTWSARVGIPAKLHLEGLLDERLASEQETTLYRIAQEALTNVARHARATHVEVILERRGDQVLLVVEDNGVGFDASQQDAEATGPENGAAGQGPLPQGTAARRESERGDDRHGFGLLGMQERAALVGGSIEIESAAGRGTTVLVRLAPLLHDRPTDHHG